MNYSVIPTPKFIRESKRLYKKYPSLRSDLLELDRNLSENPTQGTNLGGNTFKIRIAIKSKGKGKRGGARIITFIVTDDHELYLLTIYDKSEIESIDDKTLTKLIKEIKHIVYHEKPFGKFPGSH